MTAKNIFERALILAGQNTADRYIGGSDTFSREKLNIINQVLNDIGEAEITAVDSVLTLTPKKADAVTYGTARLIAVYVHDTQRQNELTDIYNRKRAAALYSVTSVKNRIPV